MKKSKLKVGDKIIQLENGAGSGRPIKITDIKTYEGNFKIIGMGAYGCTYDSVEKSHMFVKEDGTFEEITAEYVIVYITGSFNRETSIDAPNEEEAIKRFKETVGDYEIQSCELSDED